MGLVTVLPGSLVPPVSLVNLDSSGPHVNPVRRIARPVMMVLPAQEHAYNPNPQLPSISGLNNPTVITKPHRLACMVDKRMIVLTTSDSEYEDSDDDGS